MLRKTNFKLRDKHDTHFGVRQNIQRFFYPSSIGGVRKLCFNDSLVYMSFTTQVRSALTH